VSLKRSVVLVLVVIFAIVSTSAFVLAQGKVRATFVRFENEMVVVQVGEEKRSFPLAAQVELRRNGKISPRELFKEGETVMLTMGSLMVLSVRGVIKLEAVDEPTDPEPAPPPTEE
jgi:hypothetical protein